MKTTFLFRVMSIAILATSISSFAQPVDDSKNTDNNNPCSATSAEGGKSTKKMKKQAKPKKTEQNKQDQSYDPTAGIWG